MGMTIKYGGRILASYLSGDAYTTRLVWSEGDILEVQSTGILRTADTNDKGVLGLALNYKTSATDDQSVGVEGSKKQAILLDTAIIETTNWEPAMTMAAGERLYCNANGKFSHTAAGANRPIGVVISVTAAGVQGASTMTALFSPFTYIV